MPTFISLFEFVQFSEKRIICFESQHFSDVPQTEKSLLYAWDIKVQYHSQQIIMITALGDLPKSDWTVGIIHIQ